MLSVIRKHDVLRRIGYGIMALFLAVAVSLPNYAAAFDSERIQSEELRMLYDRFLGDFGAQDAYAFAPAVALPAAIAAAGITPEMAGAACLAIFTAVTAVSVSDVWDKMPTDQKARYDGSLANFGLAMGMVSGNYTFDPDDPSQPPEPNGNGGNKMNAAIIALCTGAGFVALKDLADAAGHLIGFVSNPWGEDANGLPTGLGIVSKAGIVEWSDRKIPLIYTDAFPLYDSWLSYKSTLWDVKFGSDKWLLAFEYSDRSMVIGTGYSKSSSSVKNYFGTKDPMISFVFPSLGSTAVLSTNFSASSFSFSGVWSASTGNKIYGNLSIPNAIYVNSSIEPAFTISNADVANVYDLLYQAANAPTAVSDLMQQIAAAGVGTEAANTAVANYVTNNIDNSTKVVTVPASESELSDYDKVVVDPSPAPDPTPDPDPDPSPDPSGESAADKAKRFLDLPVQQLFPFCLVYDIQLLVQHVAGGGAASRAADSLVFEFDLGFGYFDAPFVIDLTEYRDMQDTFHLAFDVLLVMGLLYFSISLFLKARSD